MQMISCERKELEKILRTFNIYVDNPCCVLTQEESKKFIQGQEKQKYDFFLKVNYKILLQFRLRYRSASFELATSHR